MIAIYKSLFQIDDVLIVFFSHLPEICLSSGKKPNIKVKRGREKILCIWQKKMYRNNSTLFLDGIKGIFRKPRLLRLVPRLAPQIIRAPRLFFQKVVHKKSLCIVCFTSNNSHLCTYVHYVHECTYMNIMYINMPNDSGLS